MRRLAPLSLAVLAACASLPPPGRPALPDVQFRIRDFRLANGLRILVEEDHGSPLVGVFTCVGVGSSGDPAGRDGLAHLIEHLMFRNKADGRNTMWDRLETSGIGILNAYTYFDNTMYFEVGSKDILDKMLQIEGARLSSPLAGVDEAVFNVEREVVRNELRQRGETQIGPAVEWLQELVFPKGSTMARPIGGSHESLTAISFDDAKKFVADNYKPSNMTMLILGDVDLATIDAVLARNLPTLFRPTNAQGPVASRIPPEIKEPPEPPPAKLLKKTATVATPELHIAWSLPRGFGDDGVLQDFVVAAAGAQLQRAWLSDPDIVSVRVELVPGIEASMLIASASLRKGEHPERSLELVLDQLVNIWTAGSEAQEAGFGSEAAVAEDRAFTRRRNGAVMRMTLDAENIMDRGSERVVSAHFTGDPAMYGRRLKELAKVGPGQVAHFAERYLKRDRARAVLVEPTPANAKENAPAQVGLGGVSDAQMDSVFPAELVRALGRSRAAGANETVVRGTKARSDETLPNGLRLIVQRRHGLPVAVVDLAFPVGEASASPPGAAELADTLAQPSNHRNGSGPEYGIFWSSNSSPSLSSITGQGANGNVPNMLAQLDEMLSGMTVEAQALATYKRDFLDYQEKFEELPQLKASRAFTAALYGDHPLGRTVRAAQLKDLGVGDLTRWTDRLYSPRGAVLVIVGDLDVDQVSADARKRFSEWKGPSNPLPALPPVALRTDAKPTVQITHRPGATQAELHIGCLAPGASTHEELANRMVAELLGSTLFRKVRGELGATYGIHGAASTLIGGTGRLEWQGDLENGRLEPALKVLKKTWDGFEEELSDQQVGRARWQQAREATLETLTSATMASMVARWVLLGRNPDEIDQVFDDLAKVSAEDMKKAWGQCKQHAVISFVGDEATIQAAAKAAGLQ